jgi:hypothetical protein
LPLCGYLIFRIEIFIDLEEGKDIILEVSRGLQESLIRRKVQVYLEHWERGFLDNICNFEMKFSPPRLGHNKDSYDSVKKGFHSWFIIINTY